MSADDIAQLAGRLHRDEWARIVAGLARRFGDLDIAEDAAAEAFLTAVERWPADGVPANPAGWLVTTATRRAIDRLRRESRRDAKQRASMLISGDQPARPTETIEDDRLRLIFVCCHPTLSPEARIALTLRLVGGLSVAEIARAFLVRETTMAQRITRGKARIRAEQVPYRVPGPEELRPRLASVLQVVYLIFNEGYLASGGQSLRAELSGEAVRLGRLLQALLPDEAEVRGLLALMVLIEARRPARLSVVGELVVLAEQDRSLWNRALVDEGLALVREGAHAIEDGSAVPGRYQLMAAINAVHAQAPAGEDTAWPVIVALYDRLITLDASPFVRLNRAVAVAEVDGPAKGLAGVEYVAELLDGYHALHVARAELLRRLARDGEARQAYDRAISLTTNPAELAHLTRRRGELRD